MCGRIKVNSHDVDVGEHVNFTAGDGKLINGVFGIKPVKGPIMYNARVEHVRTAWKNYINNKGILLIDGFYEKNWFFHRSDDKPLALPVIYNENYDFIIITRPARTPVIGVHNRMPMILADDAHEYWLSQTLFRAPDESLIRTKAA